MPASGRKSLLKVKAAGADVRMVLFNPGCLENRTGESTAASGFFAIGFETTTPPTAVAIKAGTGGGLENFSVFCNHIADTRGDPEYSGVARSARVGKRLHRWLFRPLHVSSVIGSQPYEFFAEEYQKPVVIAGFEPLDVMQSTLMLVRQINSGRHELRMSTPGSSPEKVTSRPRIWWPRCWSCAAASSGEDWGWFLTVR